MRVEELTARALEYGDIDRYQLAIAVAKRSVQISNGATSKLNIDIKKMKPADVALMEFAEGLVSIKGFTDKE